MLTWFCLPVATYYTDRGTFTSLPPTGAGTGTGMYHQHHQHHWANSSCYCVDGEVRGGDAILSARPDALLAHGGAFLPSPSPPPLSSYMFPLPPHMSSQLHSVTHLLTSGMAAAATSDLLRDRDREEEQRAVPPARYSAEERRERIDKYRSKRNQRNFQKKITYACRKTLADSRPRVKGRFARNGGDYTYTEADVVQAAAAGTTTFLSESELESPATAAAATEWWPAVHDELPAGINLADQLCTDDDDMLAAYLGVSSISIVDHHYSCHP